MDAKDYLMRRKLIKCHSFHSSHPPLFTGNWTSFIVKVRPMPLRDSVYISWLHLKGQKECHGPLMCLNFNTTWLPAEFARANSAAFSYLKRITSLKHSFHFRHHFVSQASFAYIKYTLFLKNVFWSIFCLCSIKMFKCANVYPLKWRKQSFLTNTFERPRTLNKRNHHFWNLAHDFCSAYF